MAKKQAQMRPYRYVKPADLPDLATNKDKLLAQYVIDTAPYDGVCLDVELTVGDVVLTPGYKLDVLFYDRSTGRLIEDKSQAISVNEAGLQTFEVSTSGRSVYIRVSQLAGTTPVLSIYYGLYSDSKV